MKKIIFVMYLYLNTELLWSHLWTCVTAIVIMVFHCYFILFIFFLQIHCNKGGIGFGIKREIFFLNLEDGYFGCQVNQSTDVLQLYELSRLCDGYQDCYHGSDELARELKCTSTYKSLLYDKNNRYMPTKRQCRCYCSKST